MEETEEITHYDLYYLSANGVYKLMTTPKPLSQPVAASLGGTYQIANDSPPARLVLAVDGLDKEGKTNLGLTAPGPIAYHAFDQGHEGVVEKFQTDKIVHMAQYFASITKGMSQEQVMQAVGPVWDQFLTNWKIMIAGLKSGAIRTGILDTASEAWEVLRMARFGKLAQILPHHYTALNTEYRNLIREIYNTPGNLILLHKLKNEWVDNPTTGKGGKTGAYIRAGYNDTGFLVQCNVLCWREKDPETGQKTGPYHVTIQNCRQNPLAAGVDLSTDLHDPPPEFMPQANFQWLGVSVYPQTSPEDWK